MKSVRKTLPSGSPGRIVWVSPPLVAALAAAVVLLPGAASAEDNSFYDQEARGGELQDEPAFKRHHPVQGRYGKGA